MMDAQTNVRDGGHRVFVSYARADAERKNALEKAFRVLVRNGEITLWTDACISAGSDWDQEIRKELERADIILFLVSNDFLASQYVWQNEVPLAWKRMEEGSARIIPILLAPCAYQYEPKIAPLQLLPLDGVPVFGPDDDAEYKMLEVIEGLRSILQDVPAPRARSVRRVQIPPNLVCLCDRTEQDNHFRSALQLRKDGRPFVVLMSGEESEDHSGYLTRLVDYGLPRFLGLQTPIHHHPYSLPLPVPDRNMKWRIENYLADAFRCDFESFDRFVEQHPSPIIVYSEVVGEDWERFKGRQTDAYLRYWNDWPDIPSNRDVIVCLLMKYTPQTTPEMRERISRYLSRIRWKNYPGLSGTLLPELRPVTKEDALGFANHPIVSEYCDIRSDWPGWRRAVDQLFGEERQVSMIRVIDHFSLVLDRWDARRKV